MKKIISKSLVLSLASVTLLSNSAYATSNTSTNSNEYSITNNEIVPFGAGKPKSFYVNGKGFVNQTATYLSSGKVYGLCEISKTIGLPEPSGWLGAHANLYNKNTGKVVATSNWDYNSSVSHSMLVRTPKVSAKGTYYTKGTTRVYNGNGYTSVSANESPVEIIKSLGITIPEEELKERKKLYETKNMIAAEGINGIEGYVYLEDLYDEYNQPKNPSEAIEYLNSDTYNTIRIIPLYANDGVTVIGSYQIG